MKKLNFLIVFSIILFLLNGCSKESLVGVNSGNISKGSVELKINENSTPPEVQQLSAELSRLNYDTLKTSVNITNDSSNVLSFNSVPVGEWYLSVDAENSNRKVIYHGETDVTIIEDKTVDVFITLTPVSNGIGNINIYVNWGENTWIDYQNNPVFTRYNSLDNLYGVAYTSVMYDSNIFKMWYSNLHGGGVTDIGYSESVDGINWGKIISPVLTKGQQGAWDDFKVAIAEVIKDASEYKMYYIGMQEQNNQWGIGLAVSKDRIHWQKYPSPVLSANENEFQISVHSVVKKDDVYYLYYNAFLNLSNESKICLAISSDGINWERYSNNPILAPSQNWEQGCVSNPSVIIDGNEFIMVYENSPMHVGFGMAVSKDGKNWTKLNSNPFFTTNNTSNFWASKISYPSLFNFVNEYRLYYTGYQNNDFPVIAFARKYK